MIHVRFQGRSYDLTDTMLGLERSRDEEAIRRRLARFLEVPDRELDAYVVDQRPNGDIVVRPEAVYG